MVMAIRNGNLFTGGKKHIHLAAGRFFRNLFCGCNQSVRVFPIAERTTTTWLPACCFSMQRCATLRMCARSATELPPNFITVSITVLISSFLIYADKSAERVLPRFPGRKNRSGTFLGRETLIHSIAKTDRKSKEKHKEKQFRSAVVLPFCLC